MKHGLWETVWIRRLTFRPNQSLLRHYEPPSLLCGYDRLQRRSRGLWFVVETFHPSVTPARTTNANLKYHLTGFQMILDHIRICIWWNLKRKKLGLRIESLNHARSVTCRIKVNKLLAWILFVTERRRDWSAAASSWTWSLQVMMIAHARRQTGPAAHTHRFESRQRTVSYPPQLLTMRSHHPSRNHRVLRIRKILSILLQSQKEIKSSHAAISLFFPTVSFLFFLPSNFEAEALLKYLLCYKSALFSLHSWKEKRKVRALGEQLPPMGILQFGKESVLWIHLGQYWRCAV